MPISKHVKFQIDASGRISRGRLRPKITNAVFEGAGMGGATYLKVKKVLDKHKIRLKRIGATSAGACFGMMLAFGGESNDIESFGRTFNYQALLDLNDKELKKILKDKRLGLTPAQGPKEGKGKKFLTKFKNVGRAIANLFSSGKGIYKGNRLLFELRQRAYCQVRRTLERQLKLLKGAEREAFIKQVEKIFNLHGDKKIKGETIKFLPPITFKHQYQLYQLTKKYPALGFSKFYVTGTNITKKRLEVFSHKTEPDMEIALAVRISMSIPGFFQSVKYKNCRYVDGGCLSNFPIKMFNRKRSIMGAYGQNLATVGFKPDTPSEVAGFVGPVQKPKRGVLGTVKYKFVKWFVNYFAKVKAFRSIKQEFLEVRDKYQLQTIQIPAYNVEEYKKDPKSLKRFNSTNFAMLSKDQDTMAKNGEEAADDYFENHKAGELIEVKNYTSSFDSMNHREQDKMRKIPTEYLQELHYLLFQKNAAKEIFYIPNASAERLETERRRWIVKVEKELERRKMKELAKQKLIRALTPEEKERRPDRPKILKRKHEKEPHVVVAPRRAVKDKYPLTYNLHHAPKPTAPARPSTRSRFEWARVEEKRSPFRQRVVTKRNPAT